MRENDLARFELYEESFRDLLCHIVKSLKIYHFRADLARQRIIVLLN